MAQPIEISQLSRMLAERIDVLVPHILPAARRDGQEWRVGSIHNDAGQSLAIHRAGARKGVWCDFSCDHLRGDALELISHVRCGGDKKRAVAWAKAWLGLESVDPKRFERMKVQADRANIQAQRDAARDLSKKRGFARRLWHRADARLVDTPVDHYLSGRGIDLRALPRMPGAIRFEKECFCGENGAFYPAMVTAIVGADGKVTAAHRTYLEKINGVWQKAKLQCPKKVLGPYMGGHIPLTRGASGKALRQAPAEDIIVICEGIEDGLSIALSCPEYRVLAAVSVSNFRNVVLPARLKQVMFAADNDAPGSPAFQALQNAVATMAAQGRDVYVARAPQGKDFNDLLRGGGTIDVRACQ